MASVEAIPVPKDANRATVRVSFSLPGAAERGVTFRVAERTLPVAPVGTKAPPPSAKKR